MRFLTHYTPANPILLNVNSPEHLKEVARQFLEAAGDGDVQVMEITQVPTA